MIIRSTLREIRTSPARYLAIFAIVTLGVGFFAGLKDCEASMTETAERYLKEHNMYDYKIAASYGIDDESIEIAKSNEDVKDAEATIELDIMAGFDAESAVPMRAISLPSDINKLNLIEGRLPENEDECVVDNFSIGDGDFQIGESIIISDDNDKDKLKSLKNREYKIVGKVTTPIYLDYQRGSTDIGNGSLRSFFFISKESFGLDYYTSLYVNLQREVSEFGDDYKEFSDSNQNSMDDMAKEINAARGQSAQREANEELEEKIKEYEDGLAEYEEEKASAEKKIADARAEINSNEKKLNKRAAELKSGIKKLNSGIEEAKAGIEQIKKGLAGADAAEEELKGNKTQIEAGLNEASSSKAELDAAYTAGLIDDETYAAKSAEIDAKISELNSNLAKINAGLTEITNKKAEAIAKKKETEKALEEAEKKLKEAKAGQKKVAAARKEIASARSRVNSEEANANEEFAKAEKDLKDAEKKINKAKKKIDEMESGTSYAFSRLDNTGYSSFKSNSGIVSNIAKIFPVFFFLIAALVCMTTMTRMIDEQRGQIGVLKALGYSNSNIASKYILYSGSAALLGAVLGFFGGCKIFPYVIWRAYSMMYDFSDSVDYVIDIPLGLLSIGIALICSSGATWVSISQDFRAAPAELIRPKSPPIGKRIWLEYIKPVWNRLSFLYKVSIRNVFRDKKRFFMMIIGVSGCTALLIAGFGIRTSIAKVADYQFDEISHYDFLTIFTEDMDEEDRGDYLSYMNDSASKADDIMFLHQAEVSLIAGSGSEDVTLTAADPEKFGKFIDLHSGSSKIDFPVAGEAVVVSKLGHDYGFKTGDTIKLRDGFKEAEFKVSAVADNYVYDNIYMSIETYEANFGKEAEIKTCMTIMGDDASEDVIREAAALSANYEDAAAVSVNIDVKDNVDQMMQSLNSVIVVVILSAALLAFIVLYNLTNINITERTREIATIKVLGFFPAETSRYVFRENIFLTAMSIALGVPLGRWLLKFVIDNIVVKMIYFEPKLTGMDILSSIILTFVFAAVVNLFMRIRLSAISMTESLKSVE